ncbi:response regulator [Candidatus Nitrotoga sp. M5]|uniref:response regulator n=1 Tax=Candidatus Nitrotoga sp. M5 TaxID=2890409 RepID=UPI001EF37411|nr:response regulator [Candidatus Nitrotoga sp. M5]CAH1385128.1 Response regulatory domain-containing protein [Candidatus Nitrotoga sp. M5]
MIANGTNENEVAQMIAAKKLRVLLLDDDKFTLEFVGDMLLELGVAEVFKAENGEQGIAILDGLSSQPDILICDLCMPEMDGVDFLMRLGMEGYVGKIILISGTQQHLLSGMDVYSSKLGLIPLGTLIKPIARDELATIITRFCQ